MASLNGTIVRNVTSVGGKIGTASSVSGNVSTTQTAKGKTNSTSPVSGNVNGEGNVGGDVKRLSTVYVTELRFANRYDFPSVGDSENLYIAIDENATYRFDDSTLTYKCCGRDYEEIDVIQCMLDKEN